MNQRTFTIYTKPACPYCIKAKEVLADRGFNIITMDVSKIPHALAYIKDRGHSTVPQIFLNEVSSDNYIGGYEDLLAYLT